MITSSKIPSKLLHVFLFSIGSIVILGVISLLGVSSLINPYIYPVNGVDLFIMSVTIPVYDKNKKFIGILGTDFSIEFLQSYIDGLDLQKGSSLHIFSDDNKIALSSEKELIEKDDMVS